MTNTYQTEFTRENVRALANHIQEGIRGYAEERQRPIDLFVIAAALQQTTYEIVLRSLCDSKEEGDKKIDEMKPISGDIIKAVDEYRRQNKTMPTEELLGAIFASNLLVEFYAHNRDLKLEALSQADGLPADPVQSSEEGQDVAQAEQPTESSSTTDSSTTE